MLFETIYGRTLAGESVNHLAKNPSERTKPGTALHPARCPLTHLQDNHFSSQPFLKKKKDSRKGFPSLFLPFCIVLGFVLAQDFDELALDRVWELGTGPK